MVRGLVLVVLAGVHGVERVFSSVVTDCVSLQNPMVFAGAPRCTNEGRGRPRLED